ncbi:hypothetical protein BKI52_10835 [marine bacterium AO1-C]|nr:hypothetical protein BKI52_10835 [marine bacterium AO1-C]
MNLEHDPIIVVQVLENDPTDESFDEYLDTYLGLLKEREKCSVILDARLSGFLPVRYRIKQGKFLKEHDQLIQERVHGIVFVFKSILTRFMINAIFAIKKPSYPYHLTGDMDEAFTWAKQQLDKPKEIKKAS